VGQVAIFQIPGMSAFTVVHLTSRPSLIVVAALLGIPLTPATTLLGISYRQLNYLHRFVGRMILYDISHCAMELLLIRVLRRSFTLAYILRVEGERG